MGLNLNIFGSKADALSASAPISAEKSKQGSLSGRMVTKSDQLLRDSALLGMSSIALFVSGIKIFTACKSKGNSDMTLGQVVGLAFILASPVWAVISVPLGVAGVVTGIFAATMSRAIYLPEVGVRALFGQSQGLAEA
ncbi:MAG: hypothetical protein K0S07_468 [Chlamydiales bacterium]|jgi:hypothetical protein|nr:hypothetical protein [Chlamydiales bacterium]